MATRLYLQSTGAAPFDPAIGDGGWERNSAAYVARNMATAKQNTALTTLSAVFGATATSQTRYATFVSDTLDVDQTISGNFSMVIGKCAETTTSGDAHLAYALRVVTGAGVHRATLRTSMATISEFPLIASAATRIIAAGAVTSFACNAGDRLVLEIGIHGVTPANEVMQQRIGDPTAVADFALTTALTTDLVPWGELSQTVTFGAPTTPVTMAAVAVGVPTLGRVVTYSRSLAVVAVGAPTLTKGMFKALAAVAVGVPSLSTALLFTTTLAATAVGLAVLTTVGVFSVTLAAVAVALATLGTLFIAGGGGATHRPILWVRSIVQRLTRV